MTQASTRQRGFALLIVLWSVVLLAFLVTHLTGAARSETQLAGNVRLASVLQAAADGGVNTAIFHALDTSDGHWPANGAEHELRLPGALLEVRIDNEAGKINPNSVQPQVLQALLHTQGVDQGAAARIAAAMVAWRFPDVQGDGARAPQYRNAGRDYGPPGAAFESLEEIGLVLGMTPDILARIRPYLSLYHDGDPDLRLAAPAVVQAYRESEGGDPPASGGPPLETVISITASAVGADGGRFTRRAIVRIGQRSAGRLFEILTWQDAPAS